MLVAFSFSGRRFTFAQQSSELPYANLVGLDPGVIQEKDNLEEQK